LVDNEKQDEESLDLKADEFELKPTINLALVSEDEDEDEDEDLDLIPDEAAIGPESFDSVAMAI